MRRLTNRCHTSNHSRVEPLKRSSEKPTTDSNDLQCPRTDTKKPGSAAVLRRQLVHDRARFAEPLRILRRAVEALRGLEQFVLTGGRGACGGLVAEPPVEHLAFEGSRVGQVR